MTETVTVKSGGNKKKEIDRSIALCNLKSTHPHDSTGNA